MKDIVIKAKSLVREAWVFLGCFVVACGLNIGTIIAYERPWRELYTQIGFVLVATILLYLLLWLIRGIVSLFLCAIRKIRR